MGTKDRRNNFLRRTKATAPPYTDTDTTIVETTTASTKFRRGQSKFKNRKELESRKGGNRVDERPSLSTATPSLSAPPRRSERPVRTFVRRRLGGANSTTTTSTTAAPTATPSSVSTRRPFRIASRRRPGPSNSSTTSTTSEAPVTDPTAGLASEEYLQDIEDTDVIEDPTLDPTVTAPKKVMKVQRRPLVNLKEEVHDQNPSATNEDERKRQSKKYSATFKQNQLDEVLRLKSKSQEETGDTTEGKTTTTYADLSPETAVAIAAHQLLAAPIPSISYEEDDTRPTKKSPPQTTQYYTSSETEPYTDARKTVYFDDFSSTPVYKSGTQDYIATGPAYTTLSANFDAPKVLPTGFVSKSTFGPSPSTYAINGLRAPPVPTPTVINSGLTGVSPASQSRALPTHASLTPRRPTRPGLSTIASPVSSTPRFLSTSEKLIPVPVEDYAFSTGGYTGISQEPAYFTREYLLESPVTKTYDDEYQYLSPVTTPISPARKAVRKKINRKISTTIRPTTPTNVASVTTRKPQPRRGPKAPKPFEKIKPAEQPNRTYRPIENYDYYDDGEEKVAEKYMEGTKVVLHGKGTIECLDTGNFPHPASCKKFISCSRMETGSLIGWAYICPKGLSFDPVGGICNWSAGLGCDEKDL